MFKKKKNNQTIKKLKIQLNVAIVLLILIIISGAFLLSGLSVSQIVWALSGNYSKQAGEQLTLDDWNNLPSDFVDQSGDKMEGDLDMDGNQITNLPAPGSNSEPATKSYVDSALDEINNALSNVGGGGDVFVNMGQAVCPAGTEELYDGYLFSRRYNHGGGVDPLCLQNPNSGESFAGDATATVYGDLLYPMGTYNSAYLPPSIPEKKELKCAVCYNPTGACYNKWYSDTCDGDFRQVYTGYALGNYYTNQGYGTRYCVDDIHFDGSVNNNNWDGILSGVKIRGTLDVGIYAANTWLKCAKCCK